MEQSPTHAMFQGKTAGVKGRLTSRGQFIKLFFFSYLRTRSSCDAVGNCYKIRENLDLVRKGGVQWRGAPALGGFERQRTSC